MFEKIQSSSNSIIIGTIILLFLTFFIIANLLLYYYKRKRHFAENSRLKSEFQKELLQSQLEIQEQTLKNISEEIHDNIGQVLSLAKLNLNTLPDIEDTATQQKVHNTKELVSKAIVDLRSLSRSLDAEFIMQMGLIEAIGYELDIIRKTGTIETEINISGTQFKLDKQKELIFFRIVQEVINNIIKHAKANKILVNAIYDTDKFQLTIADNGQGVDLSPLNDNDHSSFGLGIRNMNNRAKLIGADFNMSSTVGKGTEVIIILPKQMNGNGTVS
jgi:two-component system NarL family sensor kinase